MDDMNQPASNYPKYLLVIALVSLIVGILAYKYVLQDNPAPGASQNPVRSSSSVNSDTGIPKPEHYFNIDPRKPVWLLFRSETCVPCVAMQKTMDELQPEFEGKVQFISIDVNDAANREMVQKYQIVYIPANYLFDCNQKQWKQWTGATATSDMRQLLNQLTEIK